MCVNARAHGLDFLHACEYQHVLHFAFVCGYPSFFLPSYMCTHTHINILYKHIDAYARSCRPAEDSKESAKTAEEKATQDLEAAMSLKDGLLELQVSEHQVLTDTNVGRTRMDVFADALSTSLYLAGSRQNRSNTPPNVISCPCACLP
jgi:hypothetical protein